MAGYGILANQKNIKIKHPSGVSFISELDQISAYSDDYGKTWNCNLTADDFIDETIYTQTMYVDQAGGNNSNSGLTWALRKKGIGAAMTAASASGIPTRILVYAGNYVRANSWGNNAVPFVSAVPMLIEAVHGRVSTGVYDAFTWALTATRTYTYETARSLCDRVFNPSIVDKNGVYKEYVWASSIANVEATEGSWFTDGTTTYVHPHGNVTASDNNARLIITAHGAGWNCNQNLFVRGFDFEGGQNGAFKLQGGSTNRVVFDDCTFRYSAASNTYNGGSTVMDGAQILGCKLFAAFDCSADFNGKDGFNFHIESGNLPTALLVNCSAYKNGLSPSVSNNGFTCHDGVKAISIGGKYLNSFGGNCTHINDDTTVLHIGDIAGNSMGDTVFSGSTTFGGFATSTGTPHVYLYYCKDIGCSTGIYSWGTDPIKVRGHKGTGAVSGTVTQI